MPPLKLSPVDFNLKIREVDDRNVIGLLTGQYPGSDFAGRLNFFHEVAVCATNSPKIQSKARPRRIGRQSPCGRIQDVINSDCRLSGLTSKYLKQRHRVRRECSNSTRHIAVS